MTDLSRTQICMVIGDPIAQSMSPLMHNTAYEETGRSDDFIFLARKVSLEKVGDAVRGIRALGIRGVSCTLPLKEAVIPHLDELDPTASLVGAVNTIVNNDGVLTGYNTDINGIVDPLAAVTELSDKNALILGAGGAARSAVFGLKERCKAVTIFNRTEERGKKLADAADVAFAASINSDTLAAYDIIVNTTPVGMVPDTSATPLPDIQFQSNQIVMDAIYNPPITRLLSEAREAGATVITGIEMFVTQGARQFELYTGEPAPLTTMEGVVRNVLGVDSE